MHRRTGATSLMHRIATKGFTKDNHILTVHVNARNVESFEQHNGLCKAISAADFDTVDLKQYNVLCIDNADHIDEVFLKQYIKANEWSSIFLFCNEMIPCLKTTVDCVCEFSNK